MLQLLFNLFTKQGTIVRKSIVLSLLLLLVFPVLNIISSLLNRSMGKGKRLRKQVNYGDGEVRGNDDTNWQETMSDYNSDFSMPSDEDQVKKKSSLLKQ